MTKEMRSADEVYSFLEFPGKREIRAGVSIPLWKSFEDEDIIGYSHLAIYTGWLESHLCLFSLQVLENNSRDSTKILGVGFLKFYFNVVFTPY